METNISKLKSTLKTIGKCEYNYDGNIRDFKFNGKEISCIGDDFYLKLRKSFDEAITLQIINRKIDENLLKELIENTQEYFYIVKDKKDSFRASYLFTRSKGELRESSDWTHDSIMAILTSQLKTLNNLNSYLIKLFEEYKYFVDSDFKKLKIDYNINDNSESIDFPEIGKIRVKLTKKDTISLFLMLEEIGVLDFSNTDRNKILEQTFSYQNNNGKIMQLKDINSEISNLKDFKEFGARNISSFKRLIKKISLGLECFDFKQLAAKLK